MLAACDDRSFLRLLTHEPPPVFTASSTAKSDETPATGPSFGSRAAAAASPRRIAA
jgi:hypothetical protein